MSNRRRFEDSDEEEQQRLQQKREQQEREDEERRMQHDRFRRRRNQVSSNMLQIVAGIEASNQQASGSRPSRRPNLKLEPVQAYLKDDNRGLGADTSTNKFLLASEISDSSGRKYEKEEEGMQNSMVSSSCSSTAINSSNIGFQLLKKHGWKEGTGLGISKQGRLEPVQTYLKNNKRGLGAQKLKLALKPPDSTALNKKQGQEGQSRKRKGLSKKMKNMQELEKNLQEREFERAFYREFWPDNV